MNAVCAALDTCGPGRARPDAIEIEALEPSLAQIVAERRTAIRKFTGNYPSDFAVGDNYKATLPDLQNGPVQPDPRCETANPAMVGISNFFALPMPIHNTRDGGDLTLETSVTGSVSLRRIKGHQTCPHYRQFLQARDARCSAFGGDGSRSLDDYNPTSRSYESGYPKSVLLSGTESEAASGLRDISNYDIALELVRRPGGGAQEDHFHPSITLFPTLPVFAGTVRHARATRGHWPRRIPQRSVRRAFPLK